MKAKEIPGPVVYICEKNGIIAVCAEVDYDLCLLMIERKKVAYCWVGNEEINPAPRYTAFFYGNTPNQSYPVPFSEYIAGGYSHYLKLVEWCDIREAPLTIPINWNEHVLRSAFSLLDFDNIYRLFHGRYAEIPEVKR
jgi:hypothetical protein